MTEMAESGGGGYAPPPVCVAERKRSGEVREGEGV